MRQSSRKEMNWKTVKMRGWENWILGEGIGGWVSRERAYG
jgi:hypothetical protein